VNESLSKENFLLKEALREIVEKFKGQIREKEKELGLVVQHNAKARELIQELSVKLKFIGFKGKRPEMRKPKDW
jgi:hypothetical protein